MAEEPNQSDVVALSPEQAYVAIAELLQLVHSNGASSGGPTTVRQWIEHLGQQGKLPGRPESTGNIMCESIVAARDKKPYVRMSSDNGFATQLSANTAREVAANLQAAASAAEADAMVHRFFAKMAFPDGALASLMLEFRDFRTELDAEEADGAPGR